MWILLILTTAALCHGADILAIIPTPSFSHQIPFRPLWRELSRRGHNITLVTTNPMKDPSLKNFQEIDLSYGYEFMEQNNFVDVVSNDSTSFLEMAKVVRNITNTTNVVFFESSEGQNLIHNKDNHFDLLIVEAQLPAMIIFSWKYQIPFIGISSLDCSLQNHDVMGNLVHPVVTPDPNWSIADINHPNFWERLSSFMFLNLFRLMFRYITLPRETKMLRHYFGSEAPNLEEVQNNMSMLFVATNPIFHPIRPLMPNTITLGSGMHMGQSKPLEKGVGEFLDSAKNGAIYFSLGSNIKGRNLNDSTKAELIKTFSSLPYHVLWKMDHKFMNLPYNVKAEKWFSSQEEILKHPNVKLFITQGGLQSMQESIYANKPMIGIPFFGDQIMNVRRMVHFGYGLHINKHNITSTSITEAINRIMTNSSYTKKAEEYGSIFRDVDKPNVKTAAWWVEYVIRHKGARHFRNPMLDMPFWKVMMLDVFGFILLSLLIIYGIFKATTRLTLFVVCKVLSGKCNSKKKRQ